MESQCYESIQLSLNPNSESRRIGEEALKKLELDPDFSSFLVKIAQSHDATEQVRQFSLIILKTYIDTRWNLGCEKYSDGPIASQNAYSLSCMARYDWPDEWPTLFNQLLEQLSVGDANQQYSSLLVFKELITRDLSSDQLLELSLLLSELKKFFSSSNVLGIEEKTISIQILEEGIEILSLVNHKGAASDSLNINNLVSEWIQILIQILQIKITPSSVDLVALKYSTAKTLHKVSMAFPKVYSEYSEALIVCVWAEVSTYYTDYESQFLTPDSLPQKKTEWTASFTLDDSSAIDLSMYISMLLEYFDFALRQKNSKKIFIDGHLNANLNTDNFLYSLISTCVCYLQISQSSAELWSSDANEFILEEEDTSSNYSVRLASKDLLLSLVKRFPKECINAFKNILLQKLEGSQVNQFLNGFSNESILFSLELMSFEILSALKSSNDPSLDQIIRRAISEILIPGVTTPYNLFLTARSFIVASIYFDYLPPQSLSHMIEFAINQSQVLQNNPNYFEVYSHLVVQLCSIKACTKFCALTSADVIKPYLTEIIIKSVKLSDSLDQDSLTVPLECILAALKVDQSIYTTVEPVVGQLILDLWKIHYLDSLLESLFADILIKLSSTQDSFVLVFNRFAPALVSTFNEESADQIPSAIEMITSIIRGGGERSTIPTECINAIFPHLMKVLLTFKDSEIAQNGQECLKYLVQNGLYQISQYNDHNVSGLQLLFEFIESALSPDCSESSALFVGDLVAKIVIKSNTTNIISGDNLAKLVYLVLRKLAVAKSSVLVSSLLPPICYLLTKSASQVVDLLSGIMVVDNGGIEKSGLDAFISSWTENALDIQGVYFNKVSIAAMISVLMLNDSRIYQINVNSEEELFNPDVKPLKFNLRSRSKVAPIEYKKIPSPVKMIKLLIEEYLSNQDGDEGKAIGLNRKISKSRVNEDENLDDSWDEMEDEFDSEDENGFENGGEMFTSDLIDDFGAHSRMYKQFKKYDSDSEYDEVDDEDMKKDPIYNMDTSLMIKEMFIGVNSTNPEFYSYLENFLTKSEKSTLERIVSN
ncbi:Importin-9 [Smittium culicis]|uniref:Importin-9 n=1 Tax=Smittium culicis TaxID=133412 RepID=A0A1R1WZU5_9FUNG|nr:Importin-9 [Smittium culicis]OMJ08561.1 Importin-9 [Smittium culicis]